jgi:hypothetical protein
MSLSSFKRGFINSYQELFQKVLVSKEIANTRLLPNLTYGQSVDRVAYDISGVLVRTITIGTDRTVDTVSDTRETLTVSTKKGTTFAISEYEKVQAGPLNPAAVIGGKVAHKLAEYIDADVFGQVSGALYSFDNGDLTTTASTGTAITLNSTTVPQMVSRMPAKLSNYNNQTLVDLVFVVDSYAAGDVAQYLLGKNIDLAGAVFKNGYTGPVSNADMYVSNNLSSKLVLTTTGTFSDTETIVINGITFTAVASIGSTAGNFLIGANAAASLTNLAGLINNPGTTSSTQVALSAANQIVVSNNLRLAATAATTTCTIIGTGSGRLTVSETCANASFTTNYINCYFGKRGAIDLVIQDQVDMEMRDEPKQRTTNIFADALYGVKLFSDGTVKFLNVLVNA